MRSLPDTVAEIMLEVKLFEENNSNEKVEEVPRKEYKIIK